VDAKSVRYVYLCQKSGSGNPYERAWIADYLLQDCAQEMICWYDLRKAFFDNKQYESVRPFMLPGTVFFFQLDIKDIYSYLIADLMQMMTHFGRKFDDFALVHMSDQQQNPHNATMYGDFYRRWHHVARNYHWDEGFLEELQSQGQLSYFPLGYSSHLKTLSYISFSKRPAGQASVHALSKEVLKPKYRPYTMSFLGNRKSGNNKRADHLKEIEFATGRNITGQVRYDGFGKGSPQQYVDLMHKSKFCISIRGQFVECYRLYDALETGCIPVIIDEFKLKNYLSQHSEQLLPILTFPWTNILGQSVTSLERGEGRSNYQDFNTGGGGLHVTAPFVYVRTVAEFSALLDQLLHSESSLEALQAENMLWWDQMKKHYKAEMSGKLCS